MWHSYSLKSLVVYFSSPSPQNFVTIISWHLIVIYSSFSSILHPHCHHHSSHHTHCCHFQLVNSTLSFVAFIANVFFCSHSHHFKFQKSKLMLGHKNMNLNITQSLPAPKNTLTLQAIILCLNIKNLLLGRIKGDQINIIINTENILFQHSEEAWHNPLAPSTSKKSYGTEQVNTYSFPKWNHSNLPLNST